MVPYPFSRGLFLYGDPLWVSRESDDDAMEVRRLELETILNRMTEEAERAVLRHAAVVTDGSEADRAGH